MEKNVLIREFLQIIDQVYGLYLDSTFGFHYNKTISEQNQLNAIEELKVTQEYLDSCKMMFGVGDPNLPTAYILHECTQQFFKERNEKNGVNTQTLGIMCITQLYQYWEDFYRQEFAEIRNIEKNSLKSDVFGDIRLFRNSIIHHRAISLYEIDKFKIFKWFVKNQPIAFSEKHIEEIFTKIKQEIERF